MHLLVLLALDAAHIVALQAELQRFDNYDIVKYEISVDPREDGADVVCDVSIRVKRDGPVRFLLSPRAGTPVVTRDGKPVRPQMEDHWLAGIARTLPGVSAEDIPRILRLPREQRGRSITYRFTHTWKPSGKRLAYAGKSGIQTHLASAWVPTMMHEFFEVSITVKTSLPYVASTGPGAQVACLVMGDYERKKRGRFELLLPRGTGEEARAEARLADIARVAGILESWFGPALPETFCVVLDLRLRGVSYCARDFAALDGRILDQPREDWLALLAHEMAHVWWGFKLATPVVGDGGTWLREGLAEWSSIKVLGVMLGKDRQRARFRGAFRKYFRNLDLRRPEGKRGVIFANEPTLLDATYAGRTVVPYQRGALVFRMLEHVVGEKRLHGALKELLNNRDPKRPLVTAARLARELDAREWIDYYAGTTRLPDFELRDGVLRCLDPKWPGGKVPCLVDGRHVLVDLTMAGEARVAGKRIEVDPERVFLDPVRSNSAPK